MSIEIPGSNLTIGTLAGEAGVLAGRALAATGVSPQEAFMRGSRAGNYAGQYLLIALQEAGVLEVEKLDVGALKSIMNRLDVEAGVADQLLILRAEEARLFRA